MYASKINDKFDLNCSNLDCNKWFHSSCDRGSYDEQWICPLCKLGIVLDSQELSNNIETIIGNNNENNIETIIGNNNENNIETIIGNNNENTNNSSTNKNKTRRHGRRKNNKNSNASQNATSTLRRSARLNK
eukprot:53729_1